MNKASTAMSQEIAVNGRPAMAGSPGIRRYAAELGSRLAAGGATIHSPPRRAASGPPGHLWEQVVLARRARGAGLWNPGYSGPLRHPRQVITIHDLAPLDRPGDFTPRYRATVTRMQARLVEAGVTVATVSEFSRERIAATYGINEGDIALIPNGVGAAFRTTSWSPQDEAPRLLAVLGDLSRRKNVAGLMAAWAEVVAARPEATLTIVGRPATRRVLTRDVPDPADNRGVEVVSDLTDTRLAELLAGAHCHVFCPHYEGFGLPALEAAAVGVPQVLADIPPLREIDPPRATFVDPADPAEIAEAVVHTLDHPPAPASETGAGIAARYDWDRSAQLLVDLFGHRPELR